MQLSQRTTLRSLVAVLAVVTMAVGLAACGDDDGDATTTTASVVTTAGADARDAAPAVADPWVRPVMDLTAMNRTAIYMEITGGAQDDALIGASVSSDVATTVEIHETVAADGEQSPDTGGHMGDDTTTTMAGGMGDGGMDGDTSTTMAGGMGEGEGSGMMTMQPVERIEIPAGETVALQPGGFHVMLLDVQQELQPGDTVEVTLTFELAGDVVVTAEVREP